MTWPSGVVVVPSAAASDSAVVTVVVVSLTVVVSSLLPQADRPIAIVSDKQATSSVRARALELDERSISEGFPGVNGGAGGWTYPHRTPGPSWSQEP